jgi:ABC-type Zn2+ transport system substrate-binding protein/surface adhesin
MLTKLAAVTDEYIFGVQEGAGVADVGRITGIQSLLILAFNIAYGVGIAITILNAGYSFIIYIMSKGDPKEISKAQNSLIWSVAGMAIILGAWALKKIILSTLGVTNSDITGDPSNGGF